jgi:hypothetical protein
MKAKIEVKFLEVSGKKVDSVMARDKRFKKSTEKTIAELCKQIEKYFGDFDINVETNFKID